MRRPQDPVDAAFERIVRLTPEQYSRLEERLKGWQYNHSGPLPAPRKRAPKKQEAPAQ